MITILCIVAVQSPDYIITITVEFTLKNSFTSPVSMSQIRIVLSFEPETIWFPIGEKEMDQTCALLMVLRLNLLSQHPRHVLSCQLSLKQCSC